MKLSTTPVATAPVLLSIEDAAAELRSFVVGLSERVTQEAKDYFTMLGRELEAMPVEARAFLKRMEGRASNVKEVITELGAGTNTKPIPEGVPQDGAVIPPRDPELPPGSA